MQFTDDLKNWQFMSIIGVLSFLFALSNKIEQNGSYLIEDYYKTYDLLQNVFSSTIYTFDLIYINVYILLIISIILMSYFTISENIYLYSIHSFISSTIILFLISRAYIELTNVGIGVYLLISSYIFIIISLYYSLRRVYLNHESTDIIKIMWNKNSIILFISIWILFIFNIILIILNNLRIEISVY